MRLVERRTIACSNRLFLPCLGTGWFRCLNFLFWKIFALSCWLKVKYFIWTGLSRVRAFENNLRLFLGFISCWTWPRLAQTLSKLAIPKLDISTRHSVIRWLSSLSGLYLRSNYKWAVTSWTAFIIRRLICFSLRLMTQRSSIRDQLNGHLWVVDVFGSGLIRCNASS
jgi:hypothetical protein